MTKKPYTWTSVQGRWKSKCSFALWIFFFSFFVGWMDEKQPGIIFKKQMHTGGRNVIAIILLLGFLCCQITEHYY